MFTWKILELFANNDKLISVRYLLSGKDGQLIVESEGNHIFSDGIVNKSLSEIVESDILQWLEKDTTQDNVNLIKLAIENQLKTLKTEQKVDFPWLAGTFTIE
jgi:uncharacterized protein YehS (DUF1456 family)